MQRFYIRNLVIEDNAFVITDTEIIHQLTKVLRKKEGDTIVLFNGIDNVDSIFEIQNISKKSIAGEIKESLAKSNNSSKKISLIQALPNKLEKLEYIVQKGTEIGISDFVLYRSERSQKNILSDKKILRLEKIIIEAVEQCGGNSIPKLEIIEGNIDLENYRESKDIGETRSENIFCHTKNNNSFSVQDFCDTKLSTIETDIHIFIGPEGGFSDSEISAFETKKFSRIYLGGRILRTETAGMCLAFMILQLGTTY